MITYPIIETDELHLRLGSVFAANISAASNNVTTAGPQFTAADVGMPITVIGAGPLVGARGALLATTITVFNSSTSVDVADAATTTVIDDSNNTTLYRDRGALTGSIRWTEAAQFITSLSFTIRDRLPFPVRGQPVLLSLDGFGHLFGGWISRRVKRNLPKHPGGDTGWKEADCTCQCWEKLVYRRVTGQPTAAAAGSPAVSNPFAGTFTGFTLFQIFEYLAINALGAEGFSVSGPAGPVIPVFSVDYAMTGDAYDQALQAANGTTSTFLWYVDPFKVITLVDSTSAVAAPWDIDDVAGSDSDIFVQVEVAEDDSGKVNIAFVRSSALISDPVTTPFNGDSSTRTFELEHPSATTAPTITLNSGPQTVGLLNVDTGKDWYYQPGSTTITQSNTGTILTPGDTLVVVGPQIISGIVRYDNTADVTAESAIEGGTGFWEAVMQTDNPGTAADATTLAQAYATQYATVPKTLDYYTYRPGIRVGQTQHVALSDIVVDDDFLISGVEMTTSGNRMLFHVTGVGSPLTNYDWRATLATLRPGGGGPSGSTGGAVIPYEVVFVIPQSVARVVASDVTENHRRVTVNEAGTSFFLEAAYITPKSASGSSPATSLIVDVLVSQDQGVNWISLFPSGSANKIVLPAGSRGATIIPEWVINPLLDGWLLRCDIIQTTGAQSGFEISLYGSIR